MIGRIGPSATPKLPAERDPDAANVLLPSTAATIATV